MTWEHKDQKEGREMFPESGIVFIREQERPSDGFYDRGNNYPFSGDGLLRKEMISLDLSLPNLPVMVTFLSKNNDEPMIQLPNIFVIPREKKIFQIKVGNQPYRAIVADFYDETFDADIVITNDRSAKTKETWIGERKKIVLNDEKVDCRHPSFFFWKEKKQVEFVGSYQNGEEMLRGLILLDQFKKMK